MRYEDVSVEDISPIFWTQIQRTVGGKPVRAQNIAMIIDSITDQLELCGHGRLLDVGTGNGALLRLLTPRVKYALGIDPDPDLIATAKLHFELSGKLEFQTGNAEKSCREILSNGRFTSVLAYGAFQYFDQPAEFLETVTECERVDRILLGNVPEEGKASEFYGARGLRTPAEVAYGEISPHIGRWFPDTWFTDFAQANGWQVKVSWMPKDFYAHHYRFDVCFWR